MPNNTCVDCGHEWYSMRPVKSDKCQECRKKYYTIKTSIDAAPLERWLTKEDGYRVVESLSDTCKEWLRRPLK